MLLNQFTNATDQQIKQKEKKGENGGNRTETLLFTSGAREAAPESQSIKKTTALAKNSARYAPDNSTDHSTRTNRNESTGRKRKMRDQTL